MDLISEFNGGHRYFGVWSNPPRYARQVRVSCREDVVKQLNIYNGVYNCGITISTFIDDVPYLLYLPLDFDSDDLKEAWNDTIRTYNFLVESNIDCHCNYSGYRGFHILISTIPKPYSKEEVRATQMFFKRFLNLETCDKRIFGDLRRLMRIPDTLHMGKFQRDKVSREWRRLGNGSYDFTIKSNKGDLLDLDDLLEGEDLEIYLDTPPTIHSSEKRLHTYPCIDICLDTYLNERGHHEPPQLMRYSFVAYWSKMGKSEDEIYKMLEARYSKGKEYEWDDWDKYITQYQISQIAGAPDYNPLKCSTIKYLGYCNKDCEHNIDSWEFRKWDKK